MPSKSDIQTPLPEEITLYSMLHLFSNQIAYPVNTQALIFMP